jgi:uncharacterized repeat protein (TIGR01451 family)
MGLDAGLFNFVKLVSHLSFSPQAVSQLAFYARRLRGEQLTRRLSVIFGLGALGFQLAAMVAAPTASNASSPNDIIFGGFSNIEELLTVYDQGSGQPGQSAPEIQAIFSAFQISRADLAGASYGKVNSSDHSLMSLGRLPHSSLDRQLTIGDQTVYLRPLYTWGDNTDYAAIIGKNLDGSMRFAVLKSCGNIVIRGEAPPELSLQKTTLSGYPVADSEVAPGSTLGYRIAFNNLSSVAANDVVVEDPLPEQTSYINQGTGGADRFGHDDQPFLFLGPVEHAWWVFNQMPAHATGYYVDLLVQVSAQAPSGSKICNSSYIRGRNFVVIESNKICHTVKTVESVTPPPAVTPPPTPSPPMAAPPPPITPPQDTTPPPIAPAIPSLIFSKSAVYLNRFDEAGRPISAHGTTAEAGDDIEYTLRAVNQGNGNQKFFTMTEVITDILEYADVTDMRGGEIRNGVISWPETEIKSGQSVEHSFRIKVKSPIPATARSASDPQSYDLRMDNVYGNEIMIALSAPPSKEIEAAAVSLPQTGPLANLAAVAFTSLVIYFYFRNRQLIREIKILTNNGV